LIRQQALQKRHAAAVAYHKRPPRHPPPQPVVVRRKDNSDQENATNYLRNMGDVVTEQDGMPKRTSPRLNKGKNPKLNTMNTINQPIPRKTKPITQQPTINNVPAIPKEVSNELANSSPTGHDSSDDSRDSSATKGASESTATNNPTEQEEESEDEFIVNLNSKQAKDFLDKQKVEWEKTDGKKVKNVLLQDLLVSREKHFICKYNALRWERSSKGLQQSGEKWKAQWRQSCAMNEKISTEYKKNKQELKQTQEGLEKMRARNAELHTKLQRTIAKKAATRGGKRSFMEEDEVLLGLIENKAKTILWGFVKFIQGPEEEMDAARCLIKFGDFADKYCPTKEKRVAVAEMYSDKIKKAIFSKRNYTTAEEKKYYVKMWKNGKPTLTVEDLLKCLKRDIETDKDMTKFMLYWEEYLPKQVGAQEWDKNTRYYSLISTAVRKDCKSHEINLVTPEDEAFLVLSIQNGLQRWKEEFDAKQAKNLGIATAATAEETSDTTDSNKDYSGLYTSTTSGQNQYGGWSEEGLELFKTYVDFNVAARKDSNTEVLEKACLLKLRNKWGIQMATAEEQNKFTNRQKSARKRGREGVIVPTMKKVIRTMRKIDYSDDEETEDEE
jgi:hypothetical protein